MRTPLSKSAVLPCDAYGQPAPLIQWWLVEPRKLIGIFDAKSKSAMTSWTRDEAYEVLPGGSLIINNAKMEFVERYQCVALNSEVIHCIQFDSW